MSHTGGQNYITPAISGVPNTPGGAERTQMATWPACGQSGYINFALPGMPLRE